MKEIIEEVRQQIEAARLRAGLQETVHLVAVTKRENLYTINEAIGLDLLDIGENRVQDVQEKLPYLLGAPRIHFIGHLQRNKVKDLIGHIHLIHSVDSVRLAREISDQAQKAHFIQDVLVQVNAAREESKFGFFEEELEEALKEMGEMPGIHVQGLMMMAPLTEDVESLRPHFRRMKELFDYYRENNYNSVDMNYLSMGMTNDYVVAIEEGSNMVRIGTGLFPRRNHE